MNPKYFTGCETVGEVKDLYRKLAKQYHPDLCKDEEATRIMQEINAEYHAILQAMDGQVSIGSDGEEHKYYYREHIEQALIDKIHEVLAVRLPGVAVELVGTWLWVYGDPDPEATRPYKDTIKGLGFIWHGKRKKWYFRLGHRRSGRYSGKSFGQLRRDYGSARFQRDDRQPLGLGAGG
jgi:hypothetical protein